MRVRWLLATGLTLAASSAFAQTPPAGTEPPTELPPLLTPPTGPNPPPVVGPRGPTGEYDHGRFYLPDYVPPAPKTPETCRPLGRWWVNPSLELAWLSTRPAPGSVRLRVRDGTGGTIPGPVLPGCELTDNTFQGGFGLSVGRFIGDAHTSAVEGSFFTAGGGGRTFDAFSPGMVVSFPHGTSNSTPEILILPPGFDSFVGVFPATFSTWFTGADANYRHNLYCSANARLDALAGYRFAYLRDEVFLGSFPNGGSDAFLRNRAAVSNTFHGGQIGLAGEVRANRWYLSGAAKVAFGGVTGNTTATGLFAGAEGRTADGFVRLAALTASHHTDFAVLPTVSVNAGRQVREHLRVFVGYSFQYLSRVTRLGDVLDPDATGTAATTDFWVSSLNLGLELRY